VEGILSIIFYEQEYARSIIESGVDRIAQRDLNYVAKYYDSQCLPKCKVQEGVESFCIKSNPDFNVIQNRIKIKRALTNCKDNKLRVPEPIHITEKELITIGSVLDYRKEKLLFCMLVTAKFFKYHSSKKKPDENRRDVDLYINQPIKDLIELSGTKFSMKDWKVLKHEFCVAALLSPTRVSASRFAIGFDDRISDAFISVNDYRNVVGYYQQYRGESMISCDVCNVLIAKKSNRHSMCPDCWKEHRKKWDRDRKKISFPLLENN
jgi:hypothetical protein